MGLLCFPGVQLALPVLSWVSPVAGSGLGGLEVGMGVQALHLETTLMWEPARPWGAAPARPALPCSPATGRGGPGAPGRVSVAAPGLGLVGHLPRGSRCGGGALVLGERDTPPHPKNMPLLISSQVATLSGC